MAVPFDPEAFIHDVIHACKLDDATPEVLEKIKALLFLRLSDRIISTVTGWMTEEDLQKLYEIMDENPDMDPFDGLLIVAKGMARIDRKLHKAIADLYEELTYDAERIDDAMKLRRAMDQLQAQKTPSGSN